ncbi:MAG: Asp-tRNA(Asn)/Glu-tRNA(Gln) amidotransferase subunit GatC [Candidatus Wildermuthbacteria bacterium]|nr:Asp-tRNA(Asn)/Glu-tRNA(Gln) amidotransferase subunit GatC [Candidatus Wildermuthbacteria bacterium]
MITREEVEHIAMLARLRLKPEEIAKFQKDLSGILDYFSILKSADTSKTEPMTHSIKLENALRKDEPLTGTSEDAVKLASMAPESDQGYLKVPGIFQ